MPRSLAGRRWHAAAPGGFRCHAVASGGLRRSAATRDRLLDHAVAVIVHCLAIFLLWPQTVVNGSAAGLPARALGLDGAPLALRRSSATWLNGYFPVDAARDMAYQLVDGCSLAMGLWLLHRVAVVHRGLYQAHADPLPVVPMLLGAFAVEALAHAE